MENNKYYVYLTIQGEEENISIIIRYNYKEEKYYWIIWKLLDFTTKVGPIKGFKISFEEENDG